MTRRYTIVAIALHWLTAAAFAFQLALGWRMGGAQGPQTFAVFQLHKSVGITILLLTLARLGWRWLNPPPTLPADIPPGEARLAEWVHRGFYALLLALPLSGWLIVSSSKLAVPTFLYATVPWPHVPGVAGLAPAAKQAVNDAAGTAHGAMVWIALAAIALHVAGALKHQLVERGDYLRRMTAAPVRLLTPLAALILLALAGAFVIGRTVRLAPIPLAAPRAMPSPAAPDPVQPTPTLAPSARPSAAPSATPSSTPTPATVPSAWKVRTPASSLHFHTAWSQGAVDGGFGTWSAAIRFAPDALDRSAVTVTIDLASVQAASDEQRTALPSDDWFAADAHPTATWRSTGFTHLGGDRYRTDGRLTLKGATKRLPLAFTLTIKGDVATVAGTARIDRTAFGVGWAETGDLPALVDLTFALKADREAD